MGGYLLYCLSFVTELQKQTKIVTTTEVHYMYSYNETLSMHSNKYPQVCFTEMDGILASLSNYERSGH